MTTVWFYPLYTGWYFPEQPPSFQLPSEAFTWAFSRFAKDGLYNICGTDNLPEFIFHVGRYTTPRSNMKKIIPPCNQHKVSSIETSFFKEVQCYNAADTDLISNSTYVRCSLLLVENCLSTFRDNPPDYQLSSKSIYKHKSKCYRGQEQEALYSRLTVLTSMLNNQIDFIRVEKRFIYLKNNSYCDLGKPGILAHEM
jgi:hypothetical protein